MTYDYPRTYAAKTDEELLLLAHDLGSLTAAAQVALKSELERRGIATDETGKYRRQESILGETLSASVELNPAQRAPANRARWLCLWFYTMLIIFVISISVNLFLHISNAVFPLDTEPGLPSWIVVLGMLFTMKGTWKSIWQRGREMEAEIVRKRRRHLIAVSVLLTLSLSSAAELGYRNGHNRIKVHQIESVMADFAAAADASNRVEAIRARRLKTTQDYIGVYRDLEPALDEWKARIAKMSADLSLFETLRLSQQTPTVIEAERKLVKLTEQRIEVVEEEIAVIKRMSKLPARDSVVFWLHNFKPLSEREAALVDQEGELQQHISARNRRAIHQSTKN